MATRKRSVLKILGLVFAGLVGVVLLAYGGIVLLTNSMLAKTVSVDVEISPLAIREGDPIAIARGKYLVEHVMNCNVCHGPDFGGRAEVDDPMVGTLWGPNLTTGRGSRTAGHTPVDWARAIRHGVSKDGHRLVLMPSEEYYGFSDEDLGSVVSYIRSVPPVDRDDRGIKLGPLGRVLIATGEVQFAYESINHSAPRLPVQPAPTKEWGAVLAGACQGCHGPELSGGKIPGTPPEWPPARNLTPHETGLKTWTYEQFSAALRTGTRPDGTQLADFMPWRAYAGMTEDDSRALWEHLRTVTPKELGGR